MEEEYKKYDEVVYATFINMYSFAERTFNTIRFIKFEKDNDTHQLYLSIANQLSGLYGFKIEAPISFLTKLFNKKYRHIKSISENRNYIDIDEYNNFVCSGLKFPKEKIKDIYEAYYKKENK